LALNILRHASTGSPTDDRHVSAPTALTVYRSQPVRRSTHRHARGGRCAFKRDSHQTARQLTAYHEAAHALIVHGFGGVVTNVDGAGQTAYAWPPESAAVAQPNECVRDFVRAVVLFSGPVAEDTVQRPGDQPGTVAMVQACRVLPYLRERPGQNTDDDLVRVANIARRQCDSRSDLVFPYLTTAARLAEDLTRTHWETIERVARHAVRRGSIDGPAFEGLVARRLLRGDLRESLLRAPC
jgi:hypothetical protein